MPNDLTSDVAAISLVRESEKYACSLSGAAAVQDLIAAFAQTGVVWTDLNQDLDLRIAGDVRALLQSTHFDRYRPVTECGTDCLASIVSASAVSSESSCEIRPRERYRIACAIIRVAADFHVQLEWQTL
jgi:hypothetical protein